ncbi:MAG: hypothetical protein SVU88_03545 [Candidatus Nanohaloarchaea archaeon]|nr:hypothetical protein [Candidatus Nanohaloarchaea archaeon]
MDAIVFSWSGTFRDRFEQREDALASFVAAMHDSGDEVGIVTDGDIEAVEGLLDTDFAIPHVDDLSEVLGGLTSKYDKVFFVSDVKAELATANRSGAFTVGLGSEMNDAEELGGVGPNYIVDSLDELAAVLELE